jgi:YVTN family beta-propeller protein
VIDVATNTVVRSVPVGNNPFGVAVTPDRKFAYVTNYGIFNAAPGHTVSVIDTATNQVKTTIPVGLSPTGVAITPNSQFAYIANNNPGSDSVSMINTITNQVGTTIPVQPGPEGVAITPDGEFAYVTNTGTLALPGNSVSVINTATKQLARRLL